MKRKSIPKSGASRPGALLVTIGLGAGALAYAFGVFLPGQRATADLRKQLRERRMAIIQADRLLFPIHEAERELSSAQAFLQASKEASPREDEIAAVMADVHQRALAAGVEIVRFEPGKSLSLETLTQHPVAISLEGGFAAIWSFLHKVEGHPAPLWISDLRIEPKEAGQETLGAQLVLTVFSDKENNSH